MKKLTKVLYQMSHVLELAMGIFVFIAIIINGITVFQGLGALWQDRMAAHTFSDFLEQVLNLVIGIEFLKMLLKPNTDTILEVLVFVIARHMVVGTTTSVEDFLSVLSVGVLLMIKKYFGNQKLEEKSQEPFLKE